MVERKLGRGLEFLLSENVKEDWDEVRHLEMEVVKPNKSQPRVDFDEASLQEMADSIAENGLLQPIVVRPMGDGFEIVAGERRWQACRRLGQKRIPAIVREANDTQALELALIENIQRKDLNPIEKAEGFQRLIAEHGFTQEELGKRLGVDRSTAANLIRLLNLPPDVKDAVSRGTVSMGHARALLGLNSQDLQLAICKKIERDKLSVRDVESLVTEKSKKPRRKDSKPPHIRAIEDTLRLHFGTKVIVKERKKGGRIVIEFFSKDDFQRIFELMCK